MKLSDNDYENLLNIITPFAVGELEDVTSFEGKSDPEREEILKVCMKSLEVGVILFSKLVHDDSLNNSLVDELVELLKEDKLDQAAEIINKN